MTRILVIEDNPDLAFGLRNNLEIEGYQVEVATDGAVGLERARESRPDLVVLDLMLPRMDGFRVLKTLRESGFIAPVLVLTARGDESDKVRGLKLGADDYVTKPFGLLELLARVEALLRRGVAISPVTSLGDVRVDREARTVTRSGASVALAPKELDLLLALMDHRGKAVSRVQLLREVWGYRSDVTSRTVDTHVAELRRKLEEDPTKPQRIVTVRKVGYRLAL
jgi:two-component system, OmpR family, alkaline phosphatase synthesis response regulator PhoP